MIGGCPSLADVHPDDDADGLHESERLRLPGDALPAQGLRHRLPPGAERPAAQTQLQGRGYHGQCRLAALPALAQRRGRQRREDVKPVA
ncbi:hypothetical protein chiPu_0028396 [Chiloscyllium punctatum]|uniref:Uncharacterized protein n=1 Tax=Chiloscyllium punctatum TaxID=137246 RepID=A0A401TPK0_CHIPU|nr:hypothetical protein [Chiloscyllium punctatum]